VNTLICQECKQRPATLHFTKIVNGEKSEVHICEQCAHEKGDMFMFTGSPGFSISNLLAGLLNIDPTITKTQHNSFHNNDILQCERCKMTFEQFAKVGKFGCSNCYRTFQAHLYPLLKRVHGGNTHHRGKIPKRIGGGIHLKKQIEQLKQKLQNHIAREEFERAAEVRDQIRALERQLNEQREGEY
jgi:protein arginine kinase activator